MTLVEFVEKIGSLLPKYNIQIDLGRGRPGQPSTDFSVFAPPDKIWHATNLDDLAKQIETDVSKTNQQTTVEEVSALLSGLV